MEIDDLDRASAEIPEAGRARRFMVTAAVMVFGGATVTVLGFLIPPLSPLILVGIPATLIGFIAMPFAVTRVAQLTGQTRWRALGTGLRVTCKTVRDIVCSLP